MTGTEPLRLESPDDDDLLRRLRLVAVDADPVPPLVLELSRAVFALRELDAELAVLVLDSDEVTRGAAGVRGGADVRLLSYEAVGVGLELQVEQTGERRALTGQVVGPGATRLVVEAAQEAHPVTVDEDGVFRVEGLRPGPVRVRLTTADGLTVLTPWTAL